MKWENKKSDLVNTIVEEMTIALEQRLNVHLEVFKPSEEVSTLSDELLSRDEQISDLTADNDSLKLKLEYIQGYVADLEGYLSDAQGVIGDIESESYFD